MTVITMAAKCSKHVVIYNTYNPLHNCSRQKNRAINSEWPDKHHISSPEQ